MKIEMVDPQGQLLAEIADPRMKRLDVALTYAFAIRQLRAGGDLVDFGKVNDAIVERWSLSALKYIKQEAWALVEGRR